MVKGLLAGVWTLVLSFLLLFLILYVVAGFATIFIGNDAKLQDLGLQPQFRTVPDSMFTAFRCFTGDCNSDSGAPMASLLAATYGVPFIFGFVSSYLLVALGIFNVRGPGPGLFASMPLALEKILRTTGPPDQHYNVTYINIYVHVYMYMYMYMYV